MKVTIECEPKEIAECLALMTLDDRLVDKVCDKISGTTMASINSGEFKDWLEKNAETLAKQYSEFEDFMTKHCS